MARYLKQSTAATAVLGPFVDDTDGKTAETALSIANTDIRLSKNGAAFGAANAGGTHMENGYYSTALSTGNTDTVGRLTVTCLKTGALPVRHDYIVLPAVQYDALVGGTDNFDVNVTQWLGTAAATPTVAGVPEVDLTHIKGLTATVTNLEDDYTAANGFDKPLSSIGTVSGEVQGLVGGIADTSSAAGVYNTLRDVVTHGDTSWESIPALHSGTLQAGTASTVTLATTASTTAQFYRGAGVIITSGTGANQDMRLITDYTTGRVATVTPNWTTTPDATSVVDVVPAGGYVLTTGGVAIVDGGITSAKYAAGAITASAIAADAIGASELAADAVTEIQSGLSTLTQANIRTAVGLASANLDTQLDALPTAAENAAALLATALSDTARTDGAAATLEQALVELMVGLGLTKIVRSGTTLTGYKFDESTTYKTWTLDSATAPTTRTSAS